MKTRTLSVVFSFAALTAVAGTAIAEAHDGYNNAFYGKSATSSDEMAGKAAYGTPSGTSGNAWSGHEAYQRALVGSTASKSTPEVMGKAAYGIASGPDGNAIYRRAFGSSD